MGIQETPRGERFHIVFFGKRNAGKSSLLNAITGQQTAIVSEVPGTTTDPVSKAMEILPIGPCMLVDTPGLDDEGELGKKRIKKTLQAMNTADVGIVVVDISELKDASLLSDRGLPKEETELLSMLEARGIPCLLVLNQTDRLEVSEASDIRERLLHGNRRAEALEEPRKPERETG
ncbi:MAG: 50S ribosome-binding GTPase, partial [Lachnospiraceae bacterium]|nr:50S ribosome-binding GTPase [Lachnospiraceae bacterium]